jgi:hypothetical protein
VVLGFVTDHGSSKPQFDDAAWSAIAARLTKGRRKFNLVSGGRCGDHGGGAVITTPMMIMAPPAIMMVALQG